MLNSASISFSFASLRAFPAQSELLNPVGDIVLGLTAGRVISLLSRNEIHYVRLQKSQSELIKIRQFKIAIELIFDWISYH